MITVRDENGAIVSQHIELSDEIRWGYLSPSGSIMLPKHPEFADILTLPPPDFSHQLRAGQASNILMVDSSSNLLKTGKEKELDEYVYGGELALVESQNSTF